MAARRLPALTLSFRDEGNQGEHLALPSPRAALRHACPVVLEAMVGPLALFYLVLVTAGFRGALIAALVWSCLALGRRVKRGERVSTLLLLGTGLLIIRTAVSFVTGSAFLYFAQPTAGMVVISLVLFGSAALRHSGSHATSAQSTRNFFPDRVSAGSSFGFRSSGRQSSCSMPELYFGSSCPLRSVHSSWNERRSPGALLHWRSSSRSPVSWLRCAEMASRSSGAENASAKCSLSGRYLGEVS